MHTKSTATYKPAVRLTSHRGWYKVQSGTSPSVFYDTSANSCTCPARKPCKHTRFVRSLNVAFYVKAEVETPACTTVEEEHAGVTSSRGSTIVATPIVDVEANDAEQRLAHALRALADADEQSDERAVLMRRVDELERQVAADNYNAMRQVA